MKPLPKSEDSLVLRTDFSDDAAWESLCAAIRAPIHEPGTGAVRAYVECISDRAYEGLTAEQIIAACLGQPWNPRVLFVIDRIALTTPERPVLVVNLGRYETGRTFRVIPSQVQGVENNLSIGNMDFEEFADNADPDGVFRGFKES